MKSSFVFVRDTFYIYLIVCRQVLEIWDNQIKHEMNVNNLCGFVQHYSKMSNRKSSLYWHFPYNKTCWCHPKVDLQKRSETYVHMLPLLSPIIGPILDDRLKEKLMKPWKDALSSHFRVCLSVRVCVFAGYRAHLLT